MYAEFLSTRAQRCGRNVNTLPRARQIIESCGPLCRASRGAFTELSPQSTPPGWTNVEPGVLFGLLHLGGAIPEAGGDPVQAVSAAVALNFPRGMALGLAAVRTGSLMLPTAIHVSLHIMKDLLA